MGLLLLLAAGAAVITGTMLQRMVGMGTGLVVSPVFTLLFGPVDGIIFTNCASTVSAGLLAITLRRDADWRRVKNVQLGILFGSIPAALLVLSIEGAYLQISIGVVLAVSLFMAWRAPRMMEFDLLRRGIVTGAVGGFLNTSTGVAAPALLIHANLTNWEQREFAASLQPIFFAMGVISLITKFSFGAGYLEISDAWSLLVIIALAVPIGIALGARLTGYISTRAARIFAVTLVCAGIIGMMLRGISTLL